jgi:hypothetical protein
MWDLHHQCIVSSGFLFQFVMEISVWGSCIQLSLIFVVIDLMCFVDPPMGETLVLDHNCMILIYSPFYHHLNQDLRCWFRGSRSVSPFLSPISVCFGGGSVQQFGGPSDDGLGCYVLIIWVMSRWWPYRFTSTSMSIKIGPFPAGSYPSPACYSALTDIFWWCCCIALFRNVTFCPVAIMLLMVSSWPNFPVTV